MKRLAIASFVLVFTVIGCGSYNASQVPVTEPKDQSYCQRVDDMAVGMEPYMMKDKTALVFDNDLRAEEIMALNVSMVADGGAGYIVRKADIMSVDELGNEYKPMTPDEVAGRIDRALRKDAGLKDDIAGRDMPDEVKVTGQVSQHFIFYDMAASKARARRFTVSFPATSADGKSQKAFSVTVDPMRTHMNPVERWGSYDARGVVMTCMADEKAPAPKAEAVKPAEAQKMEKAAEKQERIFEKQMMK